MDIVPPLISTHPFSGSSFSVDLMPSFPALTEIVPPQTATLSLPFIPLLRAVTLILPSVIFKSFLLTMPLA